MPKKPNRKGSNALQWRRQTVPEEWALLSSLDDLLYRCQVAAEVDSRTDGRCYVPACDGQIISYPHAVPYRAGGSNAAVNRAGLCVVHSEALHSGRDPDLRQFLQDWLRRWYRDKEGLPADEWEALVFRSPVCKQMVEEAVSNV